MEAQRRVTTSLKTGASLGAAYFVSDAVGVTLAIRELFDPRPETFILLAVAAIFTIVPCALLGVAWAFTIGKYLRFWAFTQRTGRLALIAMMLITAGLGYHLRASRVAPDAESPQTIAATRPAPVLWIVIDTLRADTFYGKDINFPLTPEFRKLASDFHIFTDAESPAGWTLPSVATLMTGIHPTTLYSARGYLPNWAPTAADRLKRAGYRTHAFMDNYLLERRNGFAAGFDSFFQKSALRFAFTFPGFRLIPTRLRETLREEFEIFYFGAPRLTDQAIAHMHNKNNKPPFYYVQYMDVHYPYYPHPEISPDPPSAEPVQLHYAMAAARNDKTAPSKNQMDFLTHRYEGEVKALDTHLSRLINTFLKYYSDESLIIITSDHGEEFLEHGELGHGNSLYKELVHVPLMIRLPASIRPDTPRQDNTAVGLVDVLPTTLDVLGISSVPDSEFIGVQGSSLLGWIQGTEPRPERSIYATQNRHQRRIYRWRNQTHAYINHYDHKDKSNPTAHSQLFNKAADYDENQNLIGQHSETAKQLQKELSHFVGNQKKDRDPQKVTTVPNIDAMKALGYIE